MNHYGNDRKEVWVQKGKNIFDKNTVIKGYEVAGQNGQVAINADWYISDFMSVKGNTSYYVSGDKTVGSANCFYDENYSFINNVYGITGAISSPSNAKYLRINGKISELDNNIMVEQGNVQTEYEPFIEPKAFTLNSNNVYEEFKDSNEDTGWIKASLTSAFTAYGSNDDYTPKYRKYGNVVEIAGKIKPTKDIAGSDSTTLIFTLPKGFRPSKTLEKLQQGSEKNSWLLSIFPGGTVNFSRYGTSSYVTCSTSAWLPFHATFLAD